ncbi:MAG: phosphoglucomutase/phosphomannomutase family protein [Clostridium sp.]|uniref:phosphoglucomutase/phosphomannomutase family protein n=1 Tax=Clostridium sp. TaxID=1506 RepID=UPI003D6D926F
MIKFGTGGWRAFIGEDFTKENVQILSQAIATLMKNQKCDGSGFVVGYDNRFLSDKAAKWVSEVMAGNGIKVFFVEKSAPTPLIMFAVNSLDAYYGAAITASHNPADYNGVKIFTRGGRDANEDVTRSLEEIIKDITIDEVKLVNFDSGITHGLIEIIDPFNEFIDSIIDMIDMESIKSSKLKVALDPMFGVSKTCLQTILLTARCEVEVINNRHDTLFGGRLPSPSTHTLHRLKDLVVEKGYDIGIGTDGDADRLGIIDEKGNFIHPNDILSVLYYYLLKYKGWKGAAVRNLATTHLLDKIAAGFGEQCYEVPVGFKNISSKMEEKNALIGGESSGGLTIRGHIKGKDGIFAASLLIELLSVTGKSLSELLQEIHKQYGYFYMTESDYKFSNEVKDQLRTKLFVNKLIPNFGYEVEKTSYEDGVKVYFRNGGWIIARFSGTEPLLRIFSEMENEAMANEISNNMREFLNL